MDVTLGAETANANATAAVTGTATTAAETLPLRLCLRLRLHLESPLAEHQVAPGRLKRAKSPPPTRAGVAVHRDVVVARLPRANVSATVNVTAAKTGSRTGIVVAMTATASVVAATAATAIGNESGNVTVSKTADGAACARAHHRPLVAGTPAPLPRRRVLRASRHRAETRVDPSRRAAVRLNPAKRLPPPPSHCAPRRHRHLAPNAVSRPVRAHMAPTPSPVWPAPAPPA